ncbi:hypothetical protein AVEN_59657-1 [Araneus ventricosus]|uniref:DDE Tnp4 domain-containing protein n=1 Tax=Araneus ventricosus TaxID=182803 RepID=A0A4Y2BN05_ARAVE|nr:hypothetical protein AVEN_59657-1 [Araneus ventricosus]
MRPYSAKKLTWQQRVYNYRLSRTRRFVECGFGILANKWLILHRPIDVSIDMAGIIFEISVPSILEKEIIIEPSRSYATQTPWHVSDGVILLHDNIHTARKTQELIRKFKWEVWSQHHPDSPDSAPNLGSKLFSGTRFSSESDVKQCLELAQWTGRDFCQAVLNKLVLRSDKCLNRFGDSVEK